MPVWKRRESGTWVVQTSLGGGVAGSNGAAGTNGFSVLSGAGAPAAGLGVNGDFYIDTTAKAIYGPKAAGAWGSATSLVGPTGAAGTTLHAALTDLATSGHPASIIVNTPAGSIAATTVQAAINELDAEKSALAHTHTFDGASHDARDHTVALGTAALADLADVASFVPADGQVLTFDTTNGWQPEAIPAAGAATAITQTFTASGTWTKPAGAKVVQVDVWGGGGGGFTASPPSTQAGGGGGGAFLRHSFDAALLGATVGVTIGAGGTAGSPGTSGGTTTFGGHLSAAGGSPSPNSSNGGAGGGNLGGTAPAGASVWGGGAGGAVNVGGASTAGGGGGGGSSTAVSNAGGVSNIGGSGGASGATTGTAGTAPGGAGGGGFNGAGGAGARGECRVTTWF